MERTDDGDVCMPWTNAEQLQSGRFFTLLSLGEKHWGGLFTNLARKAKCSAKKPSNLEG